MEMKITMNKAEADALLKTVLKPKLGSVDFTVTDVSWSAYATSVTFELESVEPKIEPAPLSPQAPLSIDDDLPI